ncbi:F420-0:gamma-glutamyl ligase [Keratinibaculum paraultunense]|uniref:F420-0:gamma-glutamyl ligase n=1 Tax=Keratinibaculum paraultunense TaxID=1278232 RepID=A0A4R3KZ93_9FIRM|nr:coenzyme F420-0:L-glutamate ligase [Keratinibaculum paraultunense]QQY80043.1 coenzyme F420-0:L-glutamate ligase [Keratinibaculum paraultunense]TCS91636.1 F420-0:gamma-glutamyl ligase [Keratinibaculum paraultunense]
MVRTVGTTARGIRAPIIKKGDDLINIVMDCVLNAAKQEGFELENKDIIGITESLVARAQGNYATVDDIAKDISQKFDGDIGVVFPILSRNRFAIILKGIALTGKKIHLFLKYPCDEVGNQLMDIDKMEELGINPYTDMLTEKEYRKLFGEKVVHPFTGIDYVKTYKDLAINNNIEIYLSNNPSDILNYVDDVLVANIHDRERTKKILKKAGARKVYGLDDILTQPINGSGYNPEYGLLGSNLASENEVKLFPRDSQYYVEEIQKNMWEKLGKKIEVLIYGDGAFKDPVGKIWELADPTVSPGYTSGLEGTPNEIKLKYLADTELKNLDEKKAQEIIKNKISNKDNNLIGKEESMGTTPRRLIDLLGSLCDLVSGSGDKGTPIVLIQGYFDNYATE